MRSKPINFIRKELGTQKMKLELALEEIPKIDDKEALRRITITALKNSIKIIESFQKWVKQ